jgi:hypothetical protein
MVPSKPSRFGDSKNSIVGLTCVNIVPIGVCLPRGRAEPGIAEVLLTFPARALAPQERALLAEWAGRAGDIALAYVSERRSDDPAVYRRIVIIPRSGYPPSHLIHAPVDFPCWLVSSTGSRPQVKQFGTLHSALNSVRRILF